MKRMEKGNTQALYFVGALNEIGVGRACENGWRQQDGGGVKLYKCANN